MSEDIEPRSDAQDTPNVIGINDKKKARKPRGKQETGESQGGDKPPKLTGGEIERDLVHILERRPATALTPFPLNHVPMLPTHFEVFRARRIDDVVLAEVVDNTAYLTTKENVAASLADFCGQLGGVCLPYNAGGARHERAVKTWCYKPRPLKKIPHPWGFKSSPELCFNRLAYDPIPTDFDSVDRFAPTFGEMCSRVKNYEAFVMRLGSIFFNDASRKQALWLWGPSGGGKSQIAVLLKALMGDAYVGFDNEDFDDSFWKADLIDKRVAYVKEADPKFLQTTVFKSLTGDAGQRMNQKFVKAFQATINTVTFLASNDAPYIPNDDAIKNRVIPCYLDPVPEEKKISEEELAARFEQELPYISGFCIWFYQEYCPSHGAIKFDFDRHLQPAIDNYESEFLDIVEEKFKIGTGANWISSKDFKSILIEYGMREETQRRKFKEFLKKRYPQLREDREYRIIPGSTSTARGWGGLSKKYST